MKPILLLFSFSLFIVSNSYSQVPDYSWNKVFGGTVKQITVDASGNIYITGEYTGTRDFDPSGVTYNLTNSGSDKGLYIAKYDATGGFLWAKAINPVNSWGWVSPIGICLDDSNNVYVTGNTDDGDIDLNPDAGTNTGLSLSSASPNAFKGFVVKLYGDGAYAWAHGIYSDYGSASQTTAQVIYDGYYIKVTGVVGADYWGTPLEYASNSGCTIYGVPSGPYAESTGYIVSYDVSTGDGLSTSTYQSSIGWGNVPPRIEVDDLHYWYVLSYRSGTNMTGYLVKKDPGAVTDAWSKSGVFAGSYYAYEFYANIVEMKVDANYNIYFGGNFSNYSGFTLDFPQTNPQFSLTTTGIGDYDCFIAHYDNLGDLVNVIELESTSYDGFHGFTIDPSNGNCFVSGQLTDSLDFDGSNGVEKLYNSAPSGGFDEFIAEYDNNLGLLFAEQYGVTSSSIDIDANSLALNSSGELFAGYKLSNGPVDVDLTVTDADATAPSSNYGMIVKYASCSSAPNQPGSITGNTSACEGTSQTYSVSPVSGATSYNWTLPIGWTGTSTSESIFVTIGAGAGTIRVTAENSCGISDSSLLDVFVNAIPEQPGAITGNSIICSGTSNNYYVDPVIGATYYTWTLPSGWTGSSTSNSIDVVAGSTGGNITVTANDACGSSSPQTLAVTVNTIPATPGNISGLSSVCSGTSTTYSISPVNGATSYTWNIPVDWSGNSTIETIDVTTGTSGGTMSVTANNDCGNSSAQTLTVTVGTVNVNVIQSGNTLTAEANGATYQWLDCANNYSQIAGATNQSFTPASDGDYAVLIAESGCTDTSSCFSIIGTGIDELQLVDQLNIFPNPSSGKFEITFIAQSEGWLEIYDVLGKKIYDVQYSAFENSLTVDITAQQAGIYFLRISDGQGVKGIGKVIVQ